jgi:hypothetical protein
MHGLFLTYTLLYFILAHTTKLKVDAHLLKVRKKRNALNWKGSPLIMVANPHPLRSLA